MFNILAIFQIVLVLLKLLELITISWGLVFIPTYIVLGFVLISIILLVTMFRKDGSAYSKRFKRW